MKNLILKLFLYILFFILGTALLAYSKEFFIFIIACLGWRTVFRFVDLLVDEE